MGFSHLNVSILANSFAPCYRIHVLKYLSILLAMTCCALQFENRELRKRVSGIESEYSKFMSSRSGGVELRDKIIPGSFSVFSYKNNRLACAALKEEPKAPTEQARLIRTEPTKTSGK